MPNSKQSRKRMITDDRRRVANKTMRSRMRSAVKKVRHATDPDVARVALPEAMRCVDKCAKKNIIHANTAARVKRLLSRSVFNR